MIPGSGLGLTASAIKAGDVIGTPYGPATVNGVRTYGSRTEHVSVTSTLGMLTYRADDPYPTYRGCTEFCAQNHQHVQRNN